MADQQQGQGSAGYFLAGLVVGGLAGAAVSLLMAPRSGQETRNLLQQKGIELRDEANETAESAVKQVRQKGQQISADIGEKVGELKQRGQKLIDETRDDHSGALAGEKTGARGS